MYSDKITDSMAYAIKETNRRRKIQEEYNKKNKITPTTIIKDISDSFVPGYFQNNDKIEIQNIEKYKKEDLKYIIQELEKQMEDYAVALEFEKAINLREEIDRLQKTIKKRK